MVSRRRKRIICIVMILSFASVGITANISDFEDLTLSAESYWNGSDSSGGFTSSNAYYINNYNTTYCSWDGWSYSNMTDATTPGWLNQYSAYTGGAESGTNYAVAWDALDSGMGTTVPLINLVGGAYNTTIEGAYFTNTTYAALSMLNGDGFGKKFGGNDGTEEDWLLLTIKGIDAMGDYTANAVDFYLADYRFENDSLDYIVDEWTLVNLSSLGNIIGLEFSMSSSDTGAMGINTPAYFAMDTMVPEPMTIALLGFGGMLLRKKKFKN